MPSTLEVLYKVRENLENPTNKFQFDKWPHCTCGHIYLGATGKRGTEDKVISPDINRPKQAFYLQIAVEIAKALGFYVDKDYGGFEIEDHAMNYISDLTLKEYSDTQLPGGVTRKHALGVINRAIKEIEEAEERARLQVLTDLDFETPATSRVSTNTNERDLIEV